MNIKKLNEQLKNLKLLLKEESNPNQYLDMREPLTDEELKRVIRQDIIAEYDAVNLYQSHLVRSKNETFNKVIKHIIDEEKQHIIELQEVLKSLEK